MVKTVLRERQRTHAACSLEDPLAVWGGDRTSIYYASHNPVIGSHFCNDTEAAVAKILLNIDTKVFSLNWKQRPKVVKTLSQLSPS